MHPVLKAALEPVVDIVSPLTMEEAQVQPLPGQDRWSVQQILEHLILTYKLTIDSVSHQLKTGRVLKNRRTMLEFFLRIQTLGTGYMPNGVPSMRTTRPRDFTPQTGSELVKRFLETVEEMDALLVKSRKKFGIQTVGEHPFYGVMRVDEWRRYHAVHAAHHLSQIKNAVRYAKSVSAG